MSAEWVCCVGVIGYVLAAVYLLAICRAASRRPPAPPLAQDVARLVDEEITRLLTDADDALTAARHDHYVKRLLTTYPTDKEGS